MLTAVIGGASAAAVGRQFGYFSTTALVAIASTLGVTAVLTWFTVRVRLAPQDLRDKPSLKMPPFETRDGPPPHDRAFRGSSKLPPQPSDREK